MLPTIWRAGWRGDQDAEDVVQEADMRAFKFLRQLSWRRRADVAARHCQNTTLTWLKENRRQMLSASTLFDGHLITLFDGRAA